MYYNDQLLIMAGCTELVGLGVTIVIYIAVIIGCFVFTAPFNGWCTMLLIIIIGVELRAYYHEKVLTVEIEKRWVHERNLSLVNVGCDIEVSEVINNKNFCHPFPFKEVMKHFKSISPELIDMILRPLLGFRPVRGCTDDELYGLFLSLIFLNEPTNQLTNSYIKYGYTLEQYVWRLITVIRQKIPMGEHIKPNKGAGGYDFWALRPTRWNFPWLSLKIMELYEHKLLNKACQDGLKCHRLNTDFPVYTIGNITGSEIPTVIFHGATCKFVAIYDNLIKKMPKGMPVIAPLFTALNFYGPYSSTSHLITIDNFFDELHKFLQTRCIKRINITAWSLGGLLACSFLRRYGEFYVLEHQIYLEPLGSLASCCLMYSCVCEPMSSVASAFHERGGSDHDIISYAFSIYMKNDALTRCFWKLLPFRNIHWGTHGEPSLADTPKTLILLSASDPLTYMDQNDDMYRKVYFMKSTIVVEPGFHGTWTKTPRLAPIMEAWFARTELYEKNDNNNL